MPRQVTTHAAPTLSRRQLRNAGVAAAASIAVAVAGYGAVQTLEQPDSPAQRATAPVTIQAISDSQAMREMRAAIAGRYGSHPTASSRGQAMREMRDTVATLYGPSR